MIISGKLAPKLKINQSTRKTTRRFHTQADQGNYNIPSKFNIKNSQRLSSKPRYLDLYSKNNNLKQSVQTRKTTFKLHPHKVTNPNKYLKTEPDQCNQQMTTAPSTKIIQGQNKYQVDGTAGKGTFGVVYSGHIKGTGNKIAIKKVLQDKRYKNRQLQILKLLKHPNILQMKDYYLTYQNQNQYLNVVMDFYPENLYQTIKKKQLNSLLIKVYLYEMLRGLNYLCALSIAHRDIKPQNILVDRNTNKVVICDFGSAKQLIPGQANLAYICSRCYRAPQLIFGATNYTSQIDMWSLGCVIVEMINGEPPFLGDSQIDQLLQIIKILGTPQQNEVYDMNHNYDLKQLSKFPIIKSTDWRKLLKTKDIDLIDLVQKILVYSPKKRLTALQALQHPYFNDLRDQNRIKQITIKIKSIPDLYDFTKEQIKMFGQQTKMFPKWIQQDKIGISSTIMKNNNNSTSLPGTVHSLKKSHLYRIAF